MENFILATVILTVVVVFTGVNSFVICNICDEITECIDAGDAEQAYAIWEQHRNYISVFVRDAEIDVASAHAEALTSDIPQELGEAESSLISFREAIAEIRRSECPSFYNVF